MEKWYNTILQKINCSRTIAKRKESARSTITSQNRNQGPDELILVYSSRLVV